MNRKFRYRYGFMNAVFWEDSQTLQYIILFRNEGLTETISYIVRNRKNPNKLRILKNPNPHHKGIIAHFKAFKLVDRIKDIREKDNDKTMS